jgi:hypothetical protein
VNVKKKSHFKKIKNHNLFLLNLQDCLENTQISKYQPVQLFLLTEFLKIKHFVNTHTNLFY